MGLFRTDFYDLAGEVHSFVDKIEKAIDLGKSRISTLDSEIATIQSELQSKVSQRETEQNNITKELAFLNGVSQAFGTKSES